MSAVNPSDEAADKTVCERCETDSWYGGKRYPEVELRPAAVPRLRPVFCIQHWREELRNVRLYRRPR